MRKRCSLKIVTPIVLALSVMLSGQAGAFTPYHNSLKDITAYTDYKASYFFDLKEGSAHADAGDYKAALPYFQAAVEKNPANVMAQYNLGYTLLVLGEETISAEQKQLYLQRSEWAFLRARDLNPDLSLIYYKLGKLALMREDYATASAYYESGVANQPENFVLQFNLAATYEKRNDLDHAERAYQEVIRLNPSFVYAHNNLGLIYEQTKRLDKAEEIYRQALQSVPEYNFARLNLASLLLTQDRLTEAELLYKEAIQYEPSNPWAHLYLGNTYYKSGDYQAALSAYEKAIRLNPAYPTTYYLASLVLQKLNRPDEALAQGLQYINLAPDGAFSEEAGEIVMTLRQVKKQASNPEKP